VSCPNNVDFVIQASTQGTHGAMIHHLISARKWPSFSQAPVALSSTVNCNVASHATVSTAQIINVK
jgi:hypothetical protein